MLHTLLAAPGLPTVQGARPRMLITVDLAALFGLDPDHPAAHLTLADIAQRLGVDLAGLGLVDESDELAADAGTPDAAPHAPAPRPRAPRGAATRGRGREPRQPARYGSGIPASMVAVRRGLPAATIMAVLTLGPWRAVNVGAAHRTLPAWLRAVLLATHRHCRGPDCDRPAGWTQAHHITPWADARTTNLNDTLPLCPAHHRLIDHGWNATLDHASGEVVWASPDGRTLTVPPPEPWW